MVSSTYLGINLGFYSSEPLKASENSEYREYHNIKNKQNKEKKTKNLIKTNRQEKRKSSKKIKCYQNKSPKKLSYFSSDELNNKSIEMLSDPIIVSSPLAKSKINKRMYLPITAHGKRILIPQKYSLIQKLKNKKEKKKRILPNDNFIFEGFEDISEEYNSTPMYGKLLFKSSDDIIYEKESEIQDLACFVLGKSSLYESEKNHNNC
ncbi:unnamed protein product [Pneumocystis jirovecii]|uniref:Uncharacterized protein n=1 Tax=Pneumocystis jirovecii TaxID=42068 RepID=L0PA82_PNEJI|nr:unnamed protein product [Pneumocystis jirovecii]